MLYVLLLLSSYNRYYTRVHVPLLPKQDVEILQISKNEAQIVLKGIVNLDETLRFKNRKNDWQIDWGENMQRILNRYRCKISDFTWEPSQMTLILSMPLMGRLRLYLDRI